MIPPGMVARSWHKWIFYYFAPADVLRELGLTSIEMLIFDFLSGLK